MANRNTLLSPLVITTALTAQPGLVLSFYGAPTNLAIEAEFVYGSGGTTVDAYVQTSLDNGLSFFDIANFHFTTSSGNVAFNLSSLTPVTLIYTPVSGALSSNTCKDGLLGEAFRVLLTTTGTYAGGTTLAVYVAHNPLPQ